MLLSVSDSSNAWYWQWPRAEPCDPTLHEPASACSHWGLDLMAMHPRHRQAASLLIPPTFRLDTAQLPSQLTRIWGPSLVRTPGQASHHTNISTAVTCLLSTPGAGVADPVLVQAPGQGPSNGVQRKVPQQAPHPSHQDVVPAWHANWLEQLCEGRRAWFKQSQA